MSDEGTTHTITTTSRSPTTATTTPLCICLVVSLYSVAAAASNVASSSLGNHFVLACPWLREVTICSAYLASPIEKEITVRVSDSRKSIVSNTKEIVVTWNKPVKESFRKCRINSCFYREPRTNFAVKVFQSTSKFRITAVTQMSPASELATFVVTPQSSCYRSYFTVTTAGYPFIAVLSFDDLENNIQVQFPNSDHKFDSECSANRKCAPGKTVEFMLMKYDSWYFALGKWDARLTNVRVKADLPVYVISGSPSGFSGTEKTVKGIGITSLQPTQTWGKTYVVPRLSLSPLIVHISVLKTPFKVTFHQKDKKKIRERLYTLKTLSDPPFFYGDITSTVVVVTADSPFGLYQLFSGPLGGTTDPSRSVGVSILNLIPVELWTHVVFYADAGYSHNDFVVKYFVVAHAPRADIVFGGGDTHRKVEWKPADITVEGQTYSVAEIELGEEKVDRIYLSNATGLIMLYMTMVQKSSRITKAFAAYPYDSRIADIYQENCEETNENINVTLNDGIDNDCDGSVDEELDNGVDDDGDGLIDEDVLELYSDGQWSDWAPVCRQSCHDGVTLAVRARLCSNRSHDGRDCPGESVQCDEKTCPSNCSNPGRAPDDCFCKAGCTSCETDFFRCEQESCKSGYTTTRNCLTSCPKWRTGVGCAIVIPKPREPRKADFSHLYILPVLFVYYTVTSSVWWLVCRCVPEKKKGKAIEDRQHIIENEEGHRHAPPSLTSGSNIEEPRSEENADHHHNHHHHHHHQQRNSYGLVSMVAFSDEVDGGMSASASSMTSLVESETEV